MDTGEDNNISEMEKHRVKKLKNDVEKIMEEGVSEFHNDNYRLSAKKLRQAASVLRKIDSILDEDQNWSKRNTLNDLSGRRWLKSTKSWIIADGKSSDIPKEIKDHPGSFPPSLAAHFIEFFTKIHGFVLDPFVGIGSTLAACSELNRQCCGIEINKKYADYAEKRVKIIAKHNKKSAQELHVINDDTRNILDVWKKNKFPLTDFVITSPPYWNILGTSRGGVESAHKKRIKEGFDETYTNDPSDIGNISNYQSYLEEICSIFADIDKVLKEGAYICIIVQNIRDKDGIMRPIAWDIGYKLQSIFDLKQEFIWCQNQKFLGIWGYPTTYVSNVHHHYCLIFQKK
ncbi:MAG: site-specific DNA-methyltransferase [Candidatus Lokiarchaeota archaeon]|nr:site-specific DNA-methyltransferase [Candidatus Lokiarchaeota archaeon]